MSNGRIQWVEPISDGADPAAAAAQHGVDYASTGKVTITEGFLCPGFVDTHTHAPQYPNNGLGASLQLLDWLAELTFPLEQRYDDPGYAAKVYAEVVRRNLAVGTTTACYYGTLHETTALLADACATAGQRALVGRCSMDTGSATYVEPGAEESMQATHAFLDHFATLPPSAQALVKPVLTPRFALSCTPALMQSLGELAAARDLPVQTHISENTTEIARVKETFPGSTTYAGVYDSFGLLRPGTILAHGVHLDAAERAVIRRSGAGISHCPGSNTNLNSGAARVLAMLDEGIPVGLGTDCSGGCELGILKQLRSACQVSRVLAFEGCTPRGLSIEELFFLATRGGAQLCRMEDVGHFEAGALFDALWVRPRSPGMWVEEGEKAEMVFEKWLFTGDDRDIGAVWVNGRLVSGEA